MENVGVLPSATSLDVRHDPPILPSVPSTRVRTPLRRTSSIRPEFLSSPVIRSNVAGPSRHMISSPLRTCTPVTVRTPAPPPINTNTAPSGSGSQPLERVPTEPASAPPRQQPTADELTVLGIKVRDFALEPSTLPPVPTVRRVFPLPRDLKRQREETPEEIKRHAAQWLEFNFPGMLNETTEEREAKRLMSPSTRINSSLYSGFSRIPRPAEGGFMRQFELPSFSEPSSSSSPRTRMPLQRQLSDRYRLSTSSNRPSMTLSTGGFFGSSPRSSPSPSQLSLALQGGSRHVPNSSPHLSKSRSILGLVSELPEDFQAESQPESQAGSQSRGTNSCQATLPGLSTSQVDSEMSDLDDEEYVKTPLVSPNGSLIFDDNDRHDSAFDEARAGGSDPDSNDTETSESDAVYMDAGVSGDDSIIDSSTLPESQVGDLLAPVETGPEADVTASQMGLCESQDLLSSQPTWQQQSQSQSQVLFSESYEPKQDEAEAEDVEMPDSQLEDNEVAGEHGNRDSMDTPTISPRSTSVRVPSPTNISPFRRSASICSNHSASSPQSRPLSRIGSSSTSKTPRRSTRSLVRRSPSLSVGAAPLSRRASLSSFAVKGKLTTSIAAATSSLSSSPTGRSRYNLRTPSPKKAKLFNMPARTSTSTPRIRSRTNSAPVPKSKKAVAARGSKSRPQTKVQRGSVEGIMNIDADADAGADVMMDEESVAHSGNAKG